MNDVVNDGGAWTLACESVSHSFGSRLVLTDVSLRVGSGQVFAVGGPNGSGKSTLLRIAAGLLSPSGGTVRVYYDGRPVAAAERRRRLGYVAPDLALYGELSAAENLAFFGKLRGKALDRDDMKQMLSLVGLRGRGRDLVSGYSSGMRQRLKLAVALLNEPAFLLLDEPTANLDEAGAEMVHNIVRRQREQGGVTLLATNERAEVAWADASLHLSATGL